MENRTQAGQNTPTVSLLNRGFESGNSQGSKHLYSPQIIGESTKAVIDYAVLYCGGLVMLAGLLSIAADLLNWQSPLTIPAGARFWCYPPNGWVMAFLGPALVLSLQNRWYAMPVEQRPAYYKFAWNICIAAILCIGLYVVAQYFLLASRQISPLLLSVTSSIPPAAFFASMLAVISSLSFVLYRFSGRNETISAYVVGVFALFMIATSIFLGFGHLLHLPVLSSIQLSLVSAFCFSLVGLAMLLGTQSSGGLMLPLVSANWRVRILAWMAIAVSLFLMGEHISITARMFLQIGTPNVLTPDQIPFYLGMVMASILTFVVVMTLFLRVLTYYSESITFAHTQNALARKETMIRTTLQAIQNADDLSGAFQKTCNALGYYLNADRCFISPFQDGQLLLPVSEYRSSPDVKSMMSVDADMWTRLTRFSHLVCLTAAPLEFQPDQLDGEAGENVAEVHILLRDIQLVSGIGCGINYRGECLGALFVHHTGHQHDWTLEEKDILQVVAGQLGVAFNQGRLYDQLKLSEQRFRLLVDGAKEYALYMLDPQGFIKTWNEGNERISGFTAREMLGQHYSRLYIPEQTPDWFCDHVLEMALNTGHFEEEGLRRRKDGSLYWISVSTSALFDESGALIGYSRLMQDVSERKRVEQEVQQAREEAELANQRKSKSLAVMSHEFRTSLNAIIGYADMLLLGKVSTDRVERSIRNIADSGRYLLNIVNDILDIAQAESGKMHLSTRWVDPAQLLLDLEPMIRPQADEQGIQVRFVIDPDLPQVCWDPTRIKQAVLNLLSNAVKYNREHGLVTVYLSMNPDRDRVSIRVQDNGIGIPADKMNEIFTEFYRVTGAVASPTGTGLGLTLTRQLVELHGGAIRVESLEDVGSTFTVELPVGGPGEIATPVTPPQQALPERRELP